MHSRTLLAAALLGLGLGTGGIAHAADHLDAPALAGQGSRDINDLYAFQSPMDPANSVLIMTVNPFAGSVSGTDFGTDVSYEFAIDTDGDAVEDILYSTSFDASQNVSLVRNGTSVAMGNASGGLAVAGGGTVQTGQFDDPFFFDLAGFGDGFDFTGEDAFAGADVSAIVLEVPSSELGGGPLGVWARTVVDGTQIDRMGRPAINTVLLPGDQKDAFNAGEPVDDPTEFADEVIATITALGNGANAELLASILLPDILTFDPSSTDGYLNGRRLEDDVIDASLALLTDGALTSDLVDANDQPFAALFPYLAPANNVVAVAEPVALGLLLLGVPALVAARRRG